jgi:hypothetical protein
MLAEPFADFTFSPAGAAVYHGATLSDPSSLLKGAGRVHRHIELRTAEQLQRPEVKKLLEACRSEWRRRMEEKRSKLRNGTSVVVEH